MRTLHYAGDTILVGDDVARAIEEYALVLARRQGADLLTLPATATHASIELVLGPASQLFSEAADGPASEDGDDAVVEDIRSRQQGGSGHGQPVFDEHSVAPDHSDFDL